MKLLKLILRNLARNRRRTILTVMSIAVSLFIFALLMSLPAVVHQVLRDSAGSLRLICHGKAGFFYELPEKYGRQIRTVPHVEAVVAENVFMGTYHGPNDQVRSAALDPGDIAPMWSDFGITPQAADRFAQLRTGALVGETLMSRYRWRVGDQVMLHGTLYPVDVQLNIVGTLGNNARFVMFFRRDYLEEVLGRLGYANMFWLKVDRSESIPGVIAAIDRMFANSAAETETESELAMTNNSISNLRFLFDGMKLLAAIVIAAVAMVAGNTAAMSVRERRQEVGVMRAIGFRRETIVFCFLAEGMIIGIIGGLFGCALAYAALKAIPYASESLGPLAMMFSFPHRVFAESMTAAIAIGLAASIIPAIAATRPEISVSLRAV